MKFVFILIIVIFVAIIVTTMLLFKTESYKKGDEYNLMKDYAWATRQGQIPVSGTVWMNSNLTNDEYNSGISWVL